MSVILIAVLITLFSYDLHDKTKKHFGIVLDPRFIYVRSGSLVILLTIVVNLTFIGSARFGPEIQTLSGVIMTLIGGICLVVGGKLVQIQEEKQSYKHIFVQGVEHDEDAAYKKILGNDTEDNMKLPV
jgi:Na+-translocating ferredoxin:NAD+ oxidoreductase RnfA subunit